MTLSITKPLDLDGKTNLQRVEAALVLCALLDREAKPTTFEDFAWLVGLTPRQLRHVFRKRKGLRDEIFKRALNPTSACKSGYMRAITKNGTLTVQALRQVIAAAEASGEVIPGWAVFWQRCVEAAGIEALDHHTFSAALYRRPALKTRADGVVKGMGIRRPMRAAVVENLQPLGTTTVTPLLPTVGRQQINLSPDLRLVGGGLMTHCLGCDSLDCRWQVQGRRRDRFGRWGNWRVRGHLCADCKPRYLAARHQERSQTA